MVYQLTKFHVQRVDMVINPPWNLPFLGAKGLTSPEQTATGTKWVYRNKKDERGVVVIGKKKGLNYDEVFAPVGRDRSSGWFWAPLCLIYGVHSLSKDVISAFLYGHYDEEGLQVKQNKLPSTPMENHVAFVKDVEAFDVDVTPKTSHLNVVKRIFKYLKGKPNLGLWYPRESPLDLEAFSDSDYGVQP
ncbi:hypothetical protein Tco_0183908 [Tanacetum coccineum]